MAETNIKVKEEVSTTLEKDSLVVPQHVAIILDGNRRWAKRRGLKIIFGHRDGTESVEKMMKYLMEKGVKILTVFTFSTENWKRGEGQVSDLMQVLSEGLASKSKSLMANGISLRVIGGLDRFPEKTRNEFKDLMDKTKDNVKGILNVALDYGGRDEIVRAANKVQENGVEITEESLGECLDTSGLPDPDIILRTGGEKRLSNFLLWQGSYSELFFTDTLWPDFSGIEMGNILEEYGKRKRNFGK